ncbi:hypothetical protein LXL04_003763 [Taraxacum kok-saghyz]
MAPSLNLKTLTPNLQPIKTQHLIDEIFMHYKKQEVLSCISQPYMSKQHDITDRMRGILIDWLDEVHYKFELERQTGEGNGEYPSVNSFCPYPICFYQESSERASETNSGSQTVMIATICKTASHQQHDEELDVLSASVEKDWILRMQES